MNNTLENILIGAFAGLLVLVIQWIVRKSLKERKNPPDSHTQKGVR